MKYSLHTVGILLACLISTWLVCSVRQIHTVERDSSNFESEAQLLIFTQRADTHFMATCLPELKKWAELQDLQWRELAIKEGVPAEVTATPAIIFQNRRGRSIYANRYAELSTIQNFVRSSRVRPQLEASCCAESVLQTARGRARINVPLKLTGLTGSIPANFDITSFQTKAISAIQSGMTAYTLREEACLARTDRAFYADLHPYRDEKGELFLSLKLYAMFNCIRPVWETADMPLTNSFEQFEAVFQQAGERLSAEIGNQLRTSVIGDAWTPLSTSVSVRSWEELGLALPQGTMVVNDLPNDIKLTGSWEVSGAAIPGVPMLSFRFLTPLERYAGEVSSFSGGLQLSEDGELQRGDFVAGTRSLTMGMQELDDKVKRKYIYTKRYPDASFRFTLPAGSSLQVGQVNRFAVPGIFTMMKKEIPLLVQAEITPQATAEGKPQLYAHVNFELNITDEFGIKGPDGPERASKTLDFDLHFLLDQN